MREFCIKYQLLLTLGAFSLGSCTTTAPKWDGKIYAGDSKKVGLSRDNPGQPPEFIPANSPAFDGYMAMSYADFKSFYETYVLGCNDWSQKQLVPIGDLIQSVQSQIPAEKR